MSRVMLCINLQVLSSTIASSQIRDFFGPTELISSLPNISSFRIGSSQIRSIQIGKI